MKPPSEEQRAAVSNPNTNVQAKDPARETGAAVESSESTHKPATPATGRALPASVLTPPSPAPAPHLDDYRDIIGQAHLDSLRFLARDVKGKSIKMVNSTA